MKSFSFLAITFVLLFLLSAAAYAEPRKYIGLSLGQGKADIDCSGCDKVEDTDAGLRLLGGWQPNRDSSNPGFALEYGYTRLGEYSAHSIYNDGMTYIEETDTIEAGALFVAGCLRIPAGQSATLFGKFGLGYWSAELAARGYLILWDGFVWVNGPATASGDGTGISPLLGMGVDFQATERLSVRLEWERYSNVGDGIRYDVYVSGSYYGSGELDGMDIDVTSLGLIYSF